MLSLGVVGGAIYLPVRFPKLLYDRRTNSPRALRVLTRNQPSILDNMGGIGSIAFSYWAPRFFISSSKLKVTA